MNKFKLYIDGFMIEDVDISGLLINIKWKIGSFESVEYLKKEHVSGG